MGFEVGKKVICIKSHSQGDVKKGEVFELLGIRKATCKCKGVDLDVGIKVFGHVGYCPACNSDFPSYDDICWLDSILFAPYITAEELIESLELQTV